MVRKKYNGSFTVEAAFILPLILFIIFAFLYLGLNLHDNVCIQAILDKYGKSAQDNLRIVDKKEVEKKLEKSIEEEAKAKLCITKLENMNVHVGIVMIHIEYCECRRLNFPGIQLLLGKGTRIRKKEIVIYNPMECIRSLGGLSKK